MDLELPSFFQVNFPETSFGDVRVVEVRDMETAEPYWRRWQKAYPCSIFQSYDWCATWLRNLNYEAKPRLLIGHLQDGQFAFLLPLFVTKGVLHFIGQPDAIYGTGIFSPWAASENGKDWFRRNAGGLLASIADVRRVEFAHMPSQIQGFPNPLLGLSSGFEPDNSSLLLLNDNYENLLAAKRSRATRANIRNRDKRISQSGELAFQVLSATPEAHAALDELLRDQAIRLRESGINAEVKAGYGQFLHKWLDHKGETLRVLRLSVDGRAIASILASYFQRTVTFLMIAMPPGPLRKFSPGDMAMRQTIAHACAEGFEFFDFSLGDLPYKEPWQDQIITMHFVSRATGWAGLPGASLVLLKFAIKRFLKSNPLVWNGLRLLRRTLLGRSEI